MLFRRMTYCFTYNVSNALKEVRHDCDYGQ